jgi:CheY-like chemotaxis protein
MSQPDRHPTVLVVGAEPGLVGEYLLARSCQVVHAASGADAVVLARRHRPGLIIMDLDLENLDPYEVTVDLDGMPETRGVEIVAIVSDGDDDEAIRPRCSGRLIRPVTEGALLAVVDPCLARLERATCEGSGPAGASKVESSGRNADLLERIERLELELARTQEALAGLYEQQVSLRRVAHLAEEMAQPMTLVMGYVEMLPADLANLGAARSDCDIIAEQVKRMARTLALLRRLAPGSGLAPPAWGASGPAEKGP